MTLEVPKAEHIYAVLWLGYEQTDGEIVPVGSGVVLYHQATEYLVTALHVARACHFRPLVRRQQRWGALQWETIGIDEEADIAVLRPPHRVLSSLEPEYGRAGTVFGSVARAMGFPALTDPQVIEHIAEFEGHPIPMMALVGCYIRIGESVKVHYAAGVVNAGFSGGAILVPTTSSDWRIAGVITHVEGVVRPVQRLHPQTEKGEPTDYAYLQPSGIIRFADIGVAQAIVEQQ